MALGPDRLKECIKRLQEANYPEYRELKTDPNFLEDLAILIQRGGIDFGIVPGAEKLMLGDKIKVELDLQFVAP